MEEFVQIHMVYCVIVIKLHLMCYLYKKQTNSLSLCQAAEFRELWGSRAELRRFQDGGITEAVLWDGKSAYQKRLVPKQIITHLLQLYVFQLGRAYRTTTDLTARKSLVLILIELNEYPGQTNSHLW